MPNRINFKFQFCSRTQNMIFFNMWEWIKIIHAHGGSPPPQPENHPAQAENLCTTPPLPSQILPPNEAIYGLFGRQRRKFFLGFAPPPILPQADVLETLGPFQELEKPTPLENFGTLPDLWTLEHVWIKLIKRRSLQISKFWESQKVLKITNKNFATFLALKLFHLNFLTKKLGHIKGMYFISLDAKLEPKVMKIREIWIFKFCWNFWRVAFAFKAIKKVWLMLYQQSLCFLFLFGLVNHP